MKDKVLMRTISIILAFSFCMPTLNITYSMSPNWVWFAFFDSSEINGILSNLTYNKDIAQVMSMKEEQ